MKQLPRRLLRQGDVVLEELYRLPSRGYCRKEEPSLKIEGEQAHHHSFLGFLLVLDYLQRSEPNTVGSNTVAVVQAPAEGALVTHPQHETLEVPEGLWKVLQGREFGNPAAVD